MSGQGLELMLAVLLGNKVNDLPELKEKIDEKVSKSPDYVEKSHPKRPRPTSRIASRISGFEKTNLTVKIGGFEFRVNIEVLQMYSKYIRKMDKLKVLTLPETYVTPLAFVVIYEWMIVDNPWLPRKNIVELYKAASFLDIPSFLAQFWACTSNHIITEDSAYMIYLEAVAFEVPEIRKALLNRISRFFLPIVSCKEFLHIPVDDLAILLRSNFISVNSEVEIYMACVRYFCYNWEERRDNLLSIMKLVRYDFLPINFVLELLNHKSDIDLPEVTRMTNHPELQEILRNLLHYHCLVTFPGPNSSSMQKSLHRKWIFDPQCRYHSRENPRKMNPEYVAFTEFNSYMSYLCTTDSKHWENFESIEVEEGPKSEKKILKWMIFK